MDQEDQLATHSSILSWRTLWTEEPGGLYSPWDRKESDVTEQLTLHFSFSYFFFGTKRTNFVVTEIGNLRRKGPTREVHVSNILLLHRGLSNL